jgi:transcription antitermination protein NusB
VPIEILFSDNIPDRVAINEAVELTKLLGAHEGHKYVNGVLDKIARRKAGDMDRKL